MTGTAFSKTPSGTPRPNPKSTALETFKIHSHHQTYEVLEAVGPEKGRSELSPLPWKGKKGLRNRVFVGATFEVSETRFSMAFWSLKKFEPLLMGRFVMGSLTQVLAKLRGKAKTLEITVPKSRKKGLS